MRYTYFAPFSKIAATCPPRRFYSVWSSDELFHSQRKDAMHKIGSVLSVYLGGLLIGLTLVSFPASSAYLIDRLDLTDQQYGSIYLPQLVLTIVGALGGGFAVKYLSIKNMYVAALVSFVLSQAAFGASVRIDSSASIVLIMLATGLFGFGFGFGGGPLNGIAACLFPRNSNSAVTFLHMSAGLGMTIAPLVFSLVIQTGIWQIVPLGLAAAALFVTVITVLTKLPSPPAAPADAPAQLPSKSLYFWLIMTVAVFYALTEGTFANWAVIYVQDAKGLSPQTAANALAAFWGALTIGRLIATILLVRVPAVAIWLILPPMMAIALFLLPTIGAPSGVIAGYAFAGLACSAFFPLMVAIAAKPYPHAISYIASMLTAALMFGVGIGSYAIGSVRSVISLDTLYTLSIVYPVAIMVLIVVARHALKVDRRAISAAGRMME